MLCFKRLIFVFLFFLNFITNLPFLADEDTVFNFIFIIINRFTKFVKYIFVNKTITIKELAIVFKKYIFSDFDISKRIISDRDTIFISHF